MNKKVLIGMSGGVDSAVSALLLKKAGYEVIGATMLLFDNESSSISDAKKVCDFLDIEHLIFDFKCEFKKHVIDNFVEEYANAKTPNPCIECNKHLKFDAFYKKALELRNRVHSYRTLCKNCFLRKT